MRSTIADPEKGEAPIFKKPKTIKSLRTVPLSKELVRELRLWKMKSPMSKDSDLVIVSDQLKPVHRRRVAELIQKIVQDLKIPKHMSPHSLRHTFASLLLPDTVPIPEVSALLGHKNSAMTLSTYSHFVGEETTAVHDLSASVVGEILSPEMSPSVSLSRELVSDNAR